MRAVHCFLLSSLILMPAVACAQSPEAAPSLADPVEETLFEVSPAQERFYVGADYLLWWFHEGRVPLVLTTSSPASKGLTSNPDTYGLYGDQRLQTRHGDRFNGVRFTVGYWFTPEQTVGIEARGVIFERDSTYNKATSDGSTLLALPFTNATTGIR